MKRRTQKEFPNKVIFYNDGHSYWYKEKRFDSIGAFIKPLFPPFREDYWITHIAFKELLGTEYTDHYSTFSMDQRRTGPPAIPLFAPFLKKVSSTALFEKKKEIRMRWDKKRYEAAYKGTLFHDAREADAYLQGYMVNPFTGKKCDIPDISKKKKEHDNESLSLDLYSLPDGAYPELLVFSLNLEVAGQADKVFIETIDGIRYVDIDDYKTNEDKPAKSGPERCYPPLDGMYACDHFKYVMQINSYMYLLNTHGFTPRHMAYTHYKDYNITKETLVHVDNYQDYMPLIVDNYVKSKAFY